VIRDLRVIPWYDKRVGWCHAGFLKGARAITDKPDLKLDKSKPVVVSGHSLGAAMGLIAAKLLHSKGYTINQWVGFGCPKALIGKRENSFYCKHYQNGGDIVPTLPPFYRHQVEVVKLGETGGISFTDHPIDKYLAQMEFIQEILA